MLEIYCDSSYNKNTDSYIGCLILRDGRSIYQSTTKIISDLKDNLDCEKSAIDFALSISKLFAINGEKVIIYNDSTEAVKHFRDLDVTDIRFEFNPREKQYQSMTDSLSKKFPKDISGTSNLCKKSVESFTKDILLDIASNNRSIFYLENEKGNSTNTVTCYKLVIRSPEKTHHDGTYPVKKGGDGTQFKVASEISMDLNKPEVRSSLKKAGIEVENSYFLLTNETWGLRETDSKASSILPCSISHRIICDPVDKSPEYLFERIKAM